MSLKEFLDKVGELQKEYCNRFTIKSLNPEIIKELEVLSTQKDKNATLNFYQIDGLGVLSVVFKFKDAIKKSSVYQQVHLDYFNKFESKEYTLEMY